MRTWVEVSCSAQGVPVRVSDSAIVAAVAGLLGADYRPKVGAAVSSPAAGSDAPGRLEATRIEAVEASVSGADQDVVEDGGDDRVLSV